MRETGAETPSSVGLPIRGDFPRQEFTGRTGDVTYLVLGLLIEKPGIEIVGRQRPPVVSGAGQSVRASIEDRHRNGEVFEQLVEVLPRELEALEPPDRTRAKGDAAGKRPLDPGAGLVDHREFQVRVDGLDDLTAAAPLKLTFFTRLKD